MSEKTESELHGTGSRSAINGNMTICNTGVFNNPMPAIADQTFFTFIITVLSFLLYV